MSRLPLETVFHIIHLVCDSTEYKASLVILARVSSPVQQEAERLLYGSVVIDSDNTRLIALIATISRVPRLAHLVKSLELMSLQSLATMAFFNLMNAALVKTVELRTLRIGRRRADFVYFIFNPTCQWIFDGCTFKLRIFAVHFLFDNDLIAFLVRQSEIYHLSIHPQLSRIIYNLPPEILPVLSVLEASSMHSAYPIMKQRQVTHLRLRGFHLSLGGQSIITAVMLKRVRVCYMDSETFSSHQLISWDHLSGEAPHMKSIGCIGITELTVSHSLHPTQNFSSGFNRRRHSSRRRNSIV
jgi:hypothetical protein